MEQRFSVDLELVCGLSGFLAGRQGMFRGFCGVFLFVCFFKVAVSIRVSECLTTGLQGFHSFSLLQTEFQ